MEPKSIIISIAIMLLILGGLLFWYHVRPSNFRNACENATTEKIKKMDKKFNIQREYDSLYNLLYKECLREKGI
jgi:hypothetical protein